MSDDIGLDEKRVYAGTRERTLAFVASALGVTRVELAGDQVGRFSLVYRGTATSIAGADGQLVVGTDEDVLVGTGGEFVATDFGPAATVTLAGGTPVAAGPDGTVARLAGDDWDPVGTVASPGRADGDLLVGADGVYRVDGGLTALGGEAVRDVASAGPYAATAEGLLGYDDGWVREIEGDCTLVAATGDRVYAASEDGLLARRDGEWGLLDRPVEAPLADLAVGESLYAATADGTVLVYASAEDTPDGQGGWRSRALGARDVVGLAVP